MALSKLKEAEKIVKNHARYKLQRAIKSGNIERPNICTQCYRQGIPIQAHHPNYFEPLNVIWLCRVCHNLYHNSGWEQWKFDETMKLERHLKSNDLIEKEYQAKKG